MAPTCSWCRRARSKQIWKFGGKHKRMNLSFHMPGKLGDLNGEAVGMALGVGLEGNQAGIAPLEAM